MPPDLPGQAPVLGVSDFVAVVNQTLEYALGSVVVRGELANFRISKNRWVYFDLKDAGASVRCFGTVYMLPGPLEDGMMLEVRGVPRLHPQFNFSFNVSALRPVGEGSIKQAAQLLQAKLTAEGLFAPERKRPIPYPPAHIGLITSAQSAAYADFTKILQARWRGLQVMVADVQVQGEPAPAQLVRALDWFNRLAQPPEVLVLIRGGGSADDLAAFSNELVVRAVAASRIPTLAAIGHEVDVSLAELAADRRASTPSNAAELLVPDRQAVLAELEATAGRLSRAARQRLAECREEQAETKARMDDYVQRLFRDRRDGLRRTGVLLRALNPATALQRGFALVRDDQGRLIRASDGLQPGQPVTVQLGQGGFQASIERIDH